ncbi:hypothetical protein CBR_g27885 [Chara braunii]|uniref:DSP-PTPase phosphatase fused to NAD+ Kinase domain-containing protein n=1 Tax=Chara braunii TaxID=69332 RepID=A0A388L8L4_CHABU|nr:hypothetical protein CBR_g27885 [Chara braunii]|eukprot:GBG78659.1 hypothetical protein CBR_g27885 [Chara braunii]
MAVVPALGGATSVSRLHGYPDRLSMRAGPSGGGGSGSGSGAVVVGGPVAHACAVSLSMDSGGGRVLEARRRRGGGGCRAGIGRGVKLLLSAGGRLWRSGSLSSSRRRRCTAVGGRSGSPSEDDRRDVSPRASASSSESGNWMGNLVSNRSSGGLPSSYSESCRQAEEFECRVLSIGPPPGDVAEMEAFCRIHRLAEELHEVVMQALRNHARAKNERNQQTKNSRAGRKAAVQKPGVLPGSKVTQNTEVERVKGANAEGAMEEEGDVPEWEEKVVASLARMATVLHEGRAQLYSAAAAAAAAAAEVSPATSRLEGAGRAAGAKAPTVSALGQLRDEIRRCTINIKGSVDGVLLPGRELTNVYRALERLRNLCLDAGFARSLRAPSPVDIPNFARVTRGKDDGGAWTSTGDWLGLLDSALFCRGGQLTDEGVEWLVCNGFKAIIDLRAEDRDNQLVKPVDLEMRIPVIHMPVDLGGVPTASQVQEFARIADDPDYRPFYVHSTRGLGRACALIARWKQTVLVETMRRGTISSHGQASRNDISASEAETTRRGTRSFQGQASRKDIAVREPSMTSGAREPNLQSPGAASAQLGNSQGDLTSEQVVNVANGTATMVSNTDSDLEKKEAEGGQRSVGRETSDSSGKAQTVDAAGSSLGKSAKVPESANGALKGTGLLLREENGTASAGVESGGHDLGKAASPQVVAGVAVHDSNQNSPQQAAVERQGAGELSQSSLSNAVVRDEERASRGTVSPEVDSAGIRPQNSEQGGEEESEDGVFFMKGSVLEAQRPGPGILSREGMSMFLNRKKVIPNSMIASANRGRGRISQVTTVVVKGDEQSIAGAAGRWGRVKEGIPRAGSGSSSSEAGSNEDKKIPVPSARTSAVYSSGTDELQTSKNGAMREAGSTPSPPNGRTNRYRGRSTFSQEVESPRQFGRYADVAEGGEISVGDLSGPGEDVELVGQGPGEDVGLVAQRPGEDVELAGGGSGEDDKLAVKDSSGSLAERERDTSTTEKEIGKVMTNDDEQTVVEEVVMIEGDMCSSTTGVVRLQSRKKAEMYLVRTDGFSCTRERVRESTLAFTHPSTQQQMLMWKTPPQTVLLLKKLGDELMEEAMEERVDFVVCLGGDGVILHASNIFRTAVPPVVSFNLGSLGFLTAHPYEEFKQDLKRIIYGNSTMDGVYITLRMRLRCELFRNGKPIPGKVFDVLNEVVVDRGSNPYLCKIECYERNRLITKVQADGVIVATPTGSTAYSTAAGGSMVHPNVPCMLFTPICPHSLSFRPVILPDSALLELRVPESARSSAFVSFDCKSKQVLGRGESLSVKMSEHPMPTVNKHTGTDDWFDSLTRCFNWNERIEQRPM